ncbi:F420H2 dehydrogenase subunit F [uncultured Bacteroides sp.]|nr:F420H2 dehydrogenase subunit F [uncultured Bacteroides sp.]
MIEDAKGFLYPQVDSSICVECYACEKVCPIDTAKKSLLVPLKAFAAWNKNRKEHLLSSSGGAAYVLSSHILDSEGVVYGCTANGIDVRHIRIENKSELYKLQGSKYVQSDVRGLFKNVKEDLKNGKSVLFIGTPCQVAGLKNYIGRSVKNLYLIDLICHGVPSQKMLHEHIKYIAKGREIQKIAFRKGNDIILSLQSTDFDYEVNLWKFPYRDMYINGFMQGMIYRSSCYECPFACSDRLSDITIGDFWGLHNRESLPKEIQDGVSVLLPMTEKGLNLIYSVESKMHILERSVDEAVNGNSQLRFPSIQSRRARLFSMLYNILPFDIALNLVVVDQKIKWMLQNR